MKTMNWPYVCFSVIHLALMMVALFGMPCSANESSHDLTEKKQTTFTKNRLFSIPFYVNQQSKTPKQVHLYVSADRGRKWAHYQTRTPSDSKFDFHAGTDAEYWFVVRAVKSSFQSATAIKPQKQVVVDTKKPLLDLQVHPIDRGRISAVWRCNDAHLNARTFKLQYQTSSDAAWNSVKVVLPDDRQSSFEGEVSWMAEESSLVRVKGSIEDAAGNKNEVERVVDFENRKFRTYQPDSTATAENQGQLVPNISPQPSTQANKPAGQGRHQGERIRYTSAPKYQNEESRLTSTSPTGFMKSVSMEEKANSPIGEYPIRTNEAAGIENDADPPLPENSFRGLEMERYPRRRQVEDPDPSADVSSKIAQENAFDSVTAPPPVDPIFEKKSNANSQEAERPAFFANSRLFNLDYDVTNDDPPLRVELWVTADSGTSWHPYGIDEDRESPFLVETEVDGHYGFQLLVHGMDGRSTRPPQSGDAPDIEVTVDTQRPKAILTSATLVPSRKYGELQLRWEIQESNLGKDAITLSHSETRNGPWIVIAESIGNSNSYSWRPQAPLPDSFFVQLDVQDQAGNRTVHRFPQPISMTRQTPRARIKSIRSAR